MRRNLWLRIGLVVAVIAVCAWLLYPPEEDHQSRSRPPGRPPPRARRGRRSGHGSQVSRTGDTIKAELQKKGIGVSKVERRGVSELEVQLVSPQQWKDAQTVWADMGTFDVKESDPADRARRPRPQGRRGPPAPRAGRAPGPRDHPQPDRPVRRRRTVDPAAGGEPDPHPAPGRRRPRSAPRISSARRRCSSSSSSTTRSIPEAAARGPCRRRQKMSFSISGASTRRPSRSGRPRMSSRRRCT